MISVDRYILKIILKYIIILLFILLIYNFIQYTINIQYTNFIWGILLITSSGTF